MAAVFGQQYAPGAVFGAQEATSAAQTITAPLVDAGAQVYGPTLRLNVTVPLVDAGAQAYAPSVSIVGPQTVNVPLVDSGAEVFAPVIGGDYLTNAAPGLIPKSWPLTVRYEGKSRRKHDQDEEKRIQEIAEEAVLQASEEASKRAMKASIEASMKAAQLELAAATMDRLLKLAVKVHEEKIEEEELEMVLALL